MDDDIKCDLCGSEAKLKNVKGYIFHYKCKIMVELKVNFDAMTCTNCDQVLIKGKQTEELNKLLELSLPKGFKLKNQEEKKWIPLLNRKK